VPSKGLAIGLIAFIGIMVFPRPAQASADVGCASVGASLPLDSLPQMPLVSLSHLQFTAWNGLDADFLLENRTNQPIAYVTVVLEFHTERRDYSLPVVFEAAPDSSQPSKYLIPTERVELLAHPILPGQSKRISGRSPYTPPDCPVLARPTMLDVHFSDGSDSRWESQDWWTAPLLYDYSRSLTIPDSRAWTSDEYFFAGVINPKGQLESLVPFSHTPDPPSATVAEALKTFTFSPSLKNGTPTAADVLFIIKFIRPMAAREASKTTVTEPTVSQLTVLMSLDTVDPNGTDWHFDFGRGFGFTNTFAHHEHSGIATSAPQR
jgi:hypothetical protein